jgi:predicted PurR-regulated permease PerM
VPAIGLAIWGGAVVSTIDNLIKPYILHGQSNIHPLFALLSVLGGVTALGPIGILVGPMVVVFLQTLLKILQRELLDLDTNYQGSESDVADENTSELEKESVTKPQPDLEIGGDAESKADPSEE